MIVEEVDETTVFQVKSNQKKMNSHIFHFLF
ncbi:hypothetical protein QFZ31_001482 [Neobacillus niacini]|nr:hypothetical protein [Neobacillus niacini]